LTIELPNLEVLVKALPFVSVSVTIPRDQLGDEAALIEVLAKALKALLSLGIAPLTIKRALAKATERTQ